ncbi:MAG: DUF134 domain-containing protein [Candidatus Thorarchaeota archaeon]
MQRRRRGRRGRFPIQPRIGARPKANVMTPEPIAADVPIYLDLAEIEVLRLVDLEGMYQEQAGDTMGFSRGTVWRLLQGAREKVIRAIFEGRPLVIGGSGHEKT